MKREREVVRERERTRGRRVEERSLKGHPLAPAAVKKAVKYRPNLPSLA